MTELPTTFGKYFLTEKLATGGMAEIYLAKLVGPGGFEKQLVIKQIHPRLTGQRHFVDLFVAEAKTLVTLAHGNIVPVYELGVIDDTYFIAMEYIDGPTLYRFTEALARKGVRMETGVAAWIAAKVLEGLDYAHRKGEGVIHRDLSPRNVMLSRDGEVKLVDFGIAVTLGDADDGPDVQSAPTGSFPYMSPEQVRREALTGQTDLFSVGVLLWEMLVGERLFARPDADATLAAVTDGEIPRPSSRRPDVSAKLDDIVMRALERDTTARWSSAGEMLGALQRHLYSLDPTPGPRELAALVAKFCPPETRRIPTHADLAGDGTPPPGGPRTAVIDRDAAAGVRDAQPKAKGRARTETFATNVDLENLLSVATPLLGITRLPDPAPSAGPSTVVAPRKSAPVQTEPGSLDEDPQRDPTPVPPPEPLGGPETADELSRLTADELAKAERADTGGRSGRLPRHVRESDAALPVFAAPDEPAALPPAPDRKPAASGRMRSIRPDSDLASEPPRPDERPNLPGRAPPNRAFLVLVAIGSTVLAIGAIYIFMRGRGAVLRPDAAPKYDAPYYAFNEAGPEDIDAAIDAAPEPDTTQLGAEAGAPVGRDASPARDGTLLEPKDAGAAARDAVLEPRDATSVARDATPEPRDAAIVTGTAKLSIGANPWGDIVIDGVPRGRTPKQIEVSAGKHTIEVIFSAEDPPQKKTFSVTANPNETIPLHADFTK